MKTPFVWALVALFVSFTPTAVKAQEIASVYELKEYKVLATLWVTAIGPDVRVSSSDDILQFGGFEKEGFSLSLTPGAALIGDGEQEEWLKLRTGPLLVTIDGHASVSLGALEAWPDLALVIEWPEYPVNFDFYIGDGDSSIRFDVVQWTPVPEPAMAALMAGIPLLGLAAWRKFRC